MSKELELMKEVVKKAGAAAMEFYGKEAGVRDKGGDNPVTDADLASEKVILDGVAHLDYGILSEESEDDLVRLDKERVFVIDPLDGTKDFINQTGEFTIMIGLVENGESIAGVVYQPVPDRLYFAERGQGAWLEEKGGEPVRIGVSEIDDPSEARLLISRNHLLELEQNVAKKLGLINLIPCGSAGLKISLISSAEAEIYMNTSDKTFEWDICAAAVILSEAGGVLTDMDGGEILFNKEDPRNHKGFVVTNTLLYEMCLSAIKSF